MRRLQIIFLQQVVAAAITAAALTGIASGQIVVDTFTPTADGEDAFFWAQIPAGYSADHPPAILIWWHQYGGTQHEMRNSSQFDEIANARGWIAASHAGPSGNHYNTQRAQNHCRAMLDWLMINYPFSRDSIYMIGGSMGGAAPQIWHNNNCGSDDYLLAAAGGGSQIMDCQLRQEQYLAVGDTNRAMRTYFGGLPSERDSVAWAYHRASAVCISDTSESMHYNGLHLPVWNTWGNDSVEGANYGYVAGIWDNLRRLDDADTTLSNVSEIAGHGISLMPADSVCNWLSGFSANRYPDDISINADENGSYYWTDVELIQNDTTFGRYVAYKDSALRRIEVNCIRNVAVIAVNFDFPWPVGYETLTCAVTIGDTPIETTTLILNGVHEPYDVWLISGHGLISYEYETNLRRLTVRLTSSCEFVLDFRDAVESQPAIPLDLRISKAYPNPFNSTVVFEIESPQALSTEIIFFDVLGRRVLEKSVPLTPGVQRVFVPANELSSGSYYVRMADNPRTHRIVLIR